SFFFLKHNFDVNVSVDSLTKYILYDMNLGLKSPELAGEDMIKTWMLPPKEKPHNQKVIVIDAGGTNFRSCLVTFDSNGEYEISDFKKTSMPGIERELTKKEFFSQIADNIDYLKNKADRIGFCFSYSMNITKDGDGISTSFSKEIKAKEVIGCKIGETLCEELEKRGWNKIKKIALLNDTVSALLAGSAAVKEGCSCSSFVGFILGTGINSAYIQKSTENQIIVCESGKCDKLPRSDFDISLDKKTVCPGQYQLEKQCSGAYLGAVAYEVLNCAAKEGLFSEKTASNLLKLNSLTLIEIDSFLYAPFKKNDKYSTLSEICENDNDRKTVYEILEILVERCAKNAAAILSAVCIQCEEGKNPVHPIGILCNGTTFFKTHKLKSKIEGLLEQYLTKENGIYYELLSMENDITVGTAVAGLR
ncbi:hexokinase, partial [Treponema sp.]|uniref:hexokinase n=1 Tax=Treponema sp. TaxID=166 RepID=UPI00388F77D9